MHRHGTESGDLVEGEWRKENVGASVLQSLLKSNTQKATKHAQHIRDTFWRPGQIPWQWKMILGYGKYNFLYTFIFFVLKAFSNKRKIYKKIKSSRFSISK